MPGLSVMRNSSTYSQRLNYDAVVCCIVIVSIFILFVYFEVFELIYPWVMEHEEYELDEILLALGTSSLVFSWFAYRRWRDFKSEFEKSNTLNKQLTEALSARKKAQSALSVSWRRFVDIAEMSPDWIWECDENYNFTYVSDNFVTATGMSRNKILGRRWAEIGARSGAKGLCDRLESKKPFHGVKITMPSKNAKTARWLISGRPVLCDSGNFAGFRGIGTDMTDGKRSGMEAGDYSDRLEELINLAVIDDTDLDVADVKVKLTPREREILDWVKQGKSYVDIAEILSISPRTIEFHIANVMNKLGASNRVSAVVIAMRRGILGS
jgi:PAS domain S-box-containing protein